MQKNGRMVYSTSTVKKECPEERGKLKSKTSTRIMNSSSKDKLEWKITAKTDHSECHELFLNGKSIRTKWLPLRYENSNRSKI